MSGCDPLVMGSLRLAGMGSSQRKQEQGVRTPLLEERELVLFLFWPLMAPRGSVLLALYVGSCMPFVLGFLQGGDSGCSDQGWPPAHTATSLPVYRANPWLIRNIQGGLS